jgi:clan AA aspartic protease (TIGR02281 family)
MIRSLIAASFVLAISAAALAIGAPAQFDKARRGVAQLVETHAVAAHPAANLRTAEIQRASGGEFALHAKVNGVSTPMVIDTGATWVVLTYETAKAAGLPLELLDYDVDLETANGPTRAARLTLDRLAVGNLVELSVPALVVPRGSMKTNLLGMSFLDRLQSFEVSADRLLLRGYP